MKPIYATFLICFFAIACSAQPSGQAPPCYTDQIWARMVQQDSSLLTERRQIDEIISKSSNAYISGHISGSRSGASTASVVIPVVIYIVYDTQSVNISMAQIQSQMDQLNQDFAAYGYSFCLAKKNVLDTMRFTPQSGDSAGVFRIHSSLSNVDEYNGDAQLKALSALPSTNYLRIFVVHTISPQGVLGYALLPGSNAARDGVVIRSDVFGSNNYCASCPLLTSYNKGASLTHEVGHFLNLYHTFQGGCDTSTGTFACASHGDWVCDTPPTDGSFGCPSPAPLSCNGVDPELINNYMDYTDDPCKNAFTTGQKSRMDYAVGLYRRALISTDNLIRTGISCVQLGNQFANFFCANYNGCRGRAMTFASLHSPGFTYSWTFGDGGTTTGDTVQHTYTANGEYAVTLHAVNTSSNIDVYKSIPVFITDCSPIACGANKWDGRFAYMDFSSGTPIAENHQRAPSVITNLTFPDFFTHIYKADGNGRPLFHAILNEFDQNRPHFLALLDTAFNVVDSIEPQQDCQFLPITASPGRYCVIGNQLAIDTTSLGNTQNLIYTIIQASNGTVHCVPGKKTVLISRPAGGHFYNLSKMMVSVPSCDGTKFYTIVYLQSGRFDVYEAAGDTVTYHQTYTLTGFFNNGRLIASPDGRKITFTANTSGGHKGIFILNFDKSTGRIVSNSLIDMGVYTLFQYNNSEGTRHCFSPNSRFLYTTDACCNLQHGSMGYLYQLDLTSPNPWAGKKALYQFLRTDDIYQGPGTYFYNGPDKKIYVGHYYQPGNSAAGYRLNVINNPDVRENGLNSAGYNDNGPYIVPANCPYPNGVNMAAFYGLYEDQDAYDCSWQPDVPKPFTYSATSCLGYKFYAEDCFNAQWDFGDAASGAGNTSTLASPVHTFSHAGTFAVRLTTHGYTFTDTVRISTPSAQLSGTSIYPCPAPHATYSIATIQPGVNYNWTVTHGSPSAVSAQSDLNVQWSPTDTTGTITVIAMDTVMGCVDTAVLLVNYHISGSSVTNYAAATICPGSAYDFHGRQLTAAGTYSDTTSLGTGCTSITILSLQTSLLTVSWTGGTVSLSTLATPVPLSGGTPPGGTYSGTGVAGNTFDPATGGLGAHTITYTYTDSNGCTGTATRTFVVLGMSDMDIDSRIRLYPNPANNKLTIQSDLLDAGPVQMAIYDMTGRQMSVPVEWQRGKANLSISDISDGVYFIRLTIGGQEVVKHFVKME